MYRAECGACWEMELVKHFPPFARDCLQIMQPPLNVTASLFRLVPSLLVLVVCCRRCPATGGAGAPLRNRPSKTPRQSTARVRQKVLHDGGEGPIVLMMLPLIVMNGAVDRGAMGASEPAGSEPGEPGQRPPPTDPWGCASAMHVHGTPHGTLEPSPFWGTVYGQTHRPVNCGRRMPPWGTRGEGAAHNTFDLPPVPSAISFVQHAVVGRGRVSRSWGEEMQLSHNKTCTAPSPSPTTTTQT